MAEPFPDLGDVGLVRERVSTPMRHGHSFGSGFALGSIIYYFTSLFLDQKGAAIRYPTRFREYALGRKQKDAEETIQPLSKCDLLRHLPRRS